MSEVWRKHYRTLIQDADTVALWIDKMELFKSPKRHCFDLLALAHWWQTEQGLKDKEVPPYLLHITQVHSIAQTWLRDQSEEIQDQAENYAFTHDIGRVIELEQLHTIVGARILKTLGRKHEKEFATAHHNWGLGIQQFKNGTRKEILGLIDKSHLQLEIRQNLVDDLLPFFLPIFERIVQKFGIAALVVLVADASKHLPHYDNAQTEREKWLPEIREFTGELGIGLIKEDIEAGKYAASVEDENFLINIVSVYFLLGVISFLEQELQISYPQVIAQAQTEWGAIEKEVVAEWQTLATVGTT